MVNRPNARSRLPRVLLLSACIACGLLYIFSVRKSLLRHHTELPLAEGRTLREENSGIKPVQLIEEVGLPLSCEDKSSTQGIPHHWLHGRA